MENENSKRLYGMLGLAMKAGRLIVGTDHVVDAVRRNSNTEHRYEKSKPVKKGIVLVACDVSSNTYKRLNDACASHNVRIRRVGITAERLAALLGRYGPAAAAATFDKGFAEALIKIIDQDTKDSNDVTEGQS